MSEINKKDVERIAGLARIKLGDKEKEKMVSELGAVLAYIDKLEKVNVGDMEQTVQAGDIKNVLRKDEPMKKPLEEQSSDAVKLVEMSAENKENFVKVPAVFSE